MKVRRSYTCPLEITHDFLRGKWKTIILFQLRGGGLGLSALLRQIAGVSQKMLLQQLRELMEFGLVDKISGDGYPLRVEYFLTPRGEKALRAIKIMQEIGMEYMRETDRANDQ